MTTQPGRMAENTNTEREATGPAEVWLRSRYGAYRGHFAWRELEEAFNAGRASLPAAGQEPVAWTGGEEWEQLAWHLCAEENGEESCGELIWEGGPVPEPWGERWLKYEGEAKRMIELVRKFAAPQPAVAAGWMPIETAPKDGTRFVAIGRNYGIYSSTQHTCIAQWLRNCWMEVSDWNETSELKYLTHWMPIPPAPSTEGESNANS